MSKKLYWNNYAEIVLLAMSTWRTEERSVNSGLISEFRL